ncbi:MAG: class B sortase [Lachnospiraceae bacterium]|nr:class B sortase [Lachnospiraceae bacterium]MDY5640722.1 class B sortase [Lachnospiraceae bacterium]
MSKLEKVIIVIASLAALTAAFMIFKTARDYKAATDEYDSLRQYASEEVNATETAEKVSDIKPIELEEAEERKELKSNENREDFPEMEVDFKALREKNPDTVGWLYVGSCGISYPIVQGEDNDYYMNHTFEGTVNSSGAIIMDYRDDKYLKDWNTFIYGHNMKNGSMFGSLKKLLNDETLYDSDPYIYVYLPGYIYRYKIFSYYKDKPDSKMYWTADTLQEYRQYIRDALSLSVRDLGVETSEENNMVTLVTCSGSGAGKMRFFVHGEFIDRYKIK